MLQKLTSFQYSVAAAFHLLAVVEGKRIGCEVLVEVERGLCQQTAHTEARHKRDTQQNTCPAQPEIIMQRHLKIPRTTAADPNGVIQQRTRLTL